MVVYCCVIIMLAQIVWPIHARVWYEVGLSSVQLATSRIYKCSLHADHAPPPALPQYTE